MDFKFLNNNKNNISVGSNDGALWQFVRVNNLVQYDYDIFTDNHYGIHSFLNHFPNNFIVCIISIKGQDNVVHDIDNQGVGWGFDITSELIAITWCRFRNNTI